MKNVFLIVALSLIALGLQAQKLSSIQQLESNSVIQTVTKNATKAYGDIIWEEDFNKDKWFNTVVVDDQGYLLNATATLPEGWTFIDSTNNNYFWHWSDVGPRGAYTRGEDDDPFTPDDDILELLPEGTTIDNGFMLLESDYFNTTSEGELVTSPIEMNSYTEFGPLDFSDKKGVMFNCKLCYRMCCSPDMQVYLSLSSDYRNGTNSGIWHDIEISNISFSSIYPNNQGYDIILNVSGLASGYDSVYFRIGKRLASHYFVIIDDIKFYEPPTHNLEVQDGWADYMLDAEDTAYVVSSSESHNFWGGYTEIPQNVVSNFVKFRAAVYNFASEDAVGSKLNVNIYRDDQLVFSEVSEPKNIPKFMDDTLRLYADFLPSQIGNYQVSMTVSQDANDELPENNGWGYEFKVTESDRYSRVRHGMEDDFDDAGPRDWASGGNDGDRCVQRFAIPESDSLTKVKGISVYIDNYTNRDDEIEAIKNGDFHIIARLYKLIEKDSIVDMGISSELYTLQIWDTATWVKLYFEDEDNLLIDAGLYYAGIEIFTGNIDLRFQIGDDVNAPKQPNAGGLVYLTSQYDWYWTGDNYAIDLLVGIIDSVNVTFNVNMSFTDVFIPDIDTLYVTGNFANENNIEIGWDMPGTGESLILNDENGDGIYTGTIREVANFGELHYKYFVNAGWQGGEWEGDPNRIITIGNVDVVIDPADRFDPFESASDFDYFEMVNMAPNPFNSILTINNLSNATQIRVINILGQTEMTLPVTNNRMDINTNSLEKGIYLITIIDINNNTRTEKVVKN